VLLLLSPSLLAEEDLSSLFSLGQQIETIFSLLLTNKDKRFGSTSMLY
jgi:hypothetical protein